MSDTNDGVECPNCGCWVIVPTKETAEIERLRAIVRDLINSRAPDGIDAFAMQRAVDALPKDGWEPASVYE